MKVCIYNLTTTTQYGGVESFCWQVARGLTARGIDTTLVGGDGAIRQDAPGVRVVTFPYTSRAKLRRAPGFKKQYTLTKLAERLSFARYARAFMTRENFDLIHIQKPYDLPPAARWKQQTGARLIFGCHGTDFFPGDRRFVGAGDLAVSCSGFNASQIQARYGITPRVVYNGIDPARFFPLPPDPARRAALAGDSQTILYAGRLVRWKGVQYLIDALAQLVPTHNARLLVIGEGEYQPTLQARARERGIADRVHFLGYISPSELPAFYALADVVALASYANETFSIMSAEAHACARPVVASRFGGIPEVVADGETGLLAEPENAADFANKLAQLLDDPEGRAQMGNCARARVVELFTWDAVTDRVLEAYNSVDSRYNLFQN